MKHGCKKKRIVLEKCSSKVEKHFKGKNLFIKK